MSSACLSCWCWREVCRNPMEKKRIGALAGALLLCLTLAACREMVPAEDAGLSLEEVPDFTGEPWVELENGQPDFSPEDRTDTAAFEQYSELDYLGRCGPAYANVCPETMPEEERGEIGQIKPSGWHLAKYDCVDGKYLYNRCHLIGYQLTGENANEKNLITGTRYLNVQGMLPFENQVADYVEETGNHVLYRVTPVFDGLDLVASGVEMEAWSVEDEGAGICFHVYVYNVQPGVVIDYATGESWAEEEPPETSAESFPRPENTPAPTGGGSPESPAPAGSGTPSETHYVINVKSGRFHLPDCSGAASMSEKNREDFTGDRQELLDRGLVPCGQCKP